MQIKFRLIYLFIFCLSLPGCAKDTTQWHSLGESKSIGISGIAAIDKDHFLVVHDGKKPEHPRLSIVTWQTEQEPALSQLAWCDKTNIPMDLEATTAIPNHEHDYLVLESKGKVTRIQLKTDNAACKTIAQFELPTSTDKSNMEGLALHCIEDNCLLAWAERGDNKTPAKLSWSKFNVEENSVEKSNVSFFDFKALYPEADLRSISDIAIDSRGAVWVSATSDPGDDGFFESALYKIGSFSKEMKWTPSQETAPEAKYDSENIKIEALVFTTDDLVMATDDENKGAKIARKLFKK